MPACPQIVSEGLGLVCGVVTRQATYAVILLTFILLLLLSFSGFLTTKVCRQADNLRQSPHLHSRLAHWRFEVWHRPTLLFCAVSVFDARGRCRCTLTGCPRCPTLHTPSTR